MHIEIVYQGDPTSFGWILPLAEVPTAPNGDDLPLDELVQISSQTLFDTLQDNTDPTFALNFNSNTGQEDCEVPRSSADFAVMDAAGGFER